MKKNKRKSTDAMSPRKRRWLYALGIVLALILGAFGGASFITYRAQDQLAAGARFQQLDGVYQTLQSSYYRQVSSDKLMSGALEGMLNSLDDPFSEYLNTKNSSNLNDTISGSFKGIGAQIRKKDQAIEIVSPIANAPAQKAGLRANDLILKIDGQSTAKMTVDQAMQKIRGKVGTKVKLQIKRGQDTFDVTVKRAAVDQASVVGKLVDKDTGLIAISSFAENTVSGMKKTVRRLRKQGAKKFIFDVRGNPGGLMDTALDLSSMFLKNGQTIMSVKPRQGKAQVYRAAKKYDQGFKISEPSAVLIDGGSASSAEIFAAALQESAKIPVIGTNSYGKGTVQTLLPLDSEREIKFTTAKWLTPKGQWINKVGVKPDIKADYPKLAKLALINANKTLKKGAVGEQVKLLQQNLSLLGYTPIQVSGQYDDQTVAAIKQLQTKHDLTISGEFDQATYTALYEEVATYLQKNDLAQQKAIQQLNKVD